jgi:hypothetical protein
MIIHRIIKIKVGINIEDPIHHGMFIGNTRDGINWVDFKYENLPMFCFSCGLIGHNEENCTFPALALPEGGLTLEDLGLDLTYMAKEFMKTETKDFTAILCSQ